MYIYQLDRVLLKKQIKAFSHYITGEVLDVGSGGHDRYQSLFIVQRNRYKRMDIHTGENIDIVGSADAIPCQGNSFDSIVSTQVFEHLPFPEAAVKEIGRVLRSGGHALITAPQWTELHEEPYDYFRYTKYGLQALFERNGFILVAMDQRGGFFCEGAQRVSRYLINRFNLYQRPLAGRFMSRVFKFTGTLAQWLDRIDNTPANRRHAIGWCVVFKKI